MNRSEVNQNGIGAGPDIDFGVVSHRTGQPIERGPLVDKLVTELEDLRDKAGDNDQAKKTINKALKLLEKKSKPPTRIDRTAGQAYQVPSEWDSAQKIINEVIIDQLVNLSLELKGRNFTSVDKAIRSIEDGVSEPPKSAVQALEFQRQQYDVKPASCFNFRETAAARDNRYRHMKVMVRNI